MTYIISKRRKNKIKIITCILGIILILFAAAIYIKYNEQVNNDIWNDTWNEEAWVSRMKEISIPDFAGSPWVELNNGVPLFDASEKNTDVFEYYSDLDELGRCRVAYANICTELMPTEKRGEIGQIKPSGWKQAKYEGIVNSSPPFLYNRCHLIAFCLTGENANEKNLITGTRYMNVEGMLPWEEKIAKYVENTGNHVLYRVTPDFRENELVARGVYIEAYSVEDKGEGICFFVYCYNVQPGVVIDYGNGESRML